MLRVFCMRVMRSFRKSQKRISITVKVLFISIRTSKKWAKTAEKVILNTFSCFVNFCAISFELSASCSVKIGDILILCNKRERKRNRCLRPRTFRKTVSRSRQDFCFFFFFVLATLRPRSCNVTAAMEPFSFPIFFLFWWSLTARQAKQRPGKIAATNKKQRVEKTLRTLSDFIPKPYFFGEQYALFCAYNEQHSTAR